MESAKKEKAPTAVGAQPRHRRANSLVFFLLRSILRPALFLLYGFRFDMRSSKGVRLPCLILANHQTSFDQFSVSMGFRFGINYVASDTIFRRGFLSRLMIALVRPIPFSKGSSDLTALKSMMSVIKAGGSVAMFPSGNRSFYGDECRIVPGAGRLAKLFGVPLVLVRQRGGFNTLPRWRVKRSRGRMTAEVSRIVSREELAAMTAGEIDDLILREIGFDEFAWNRVERQAFRGSRKAEFLESVLFFCPECGRMGAASGGSDGSADVIIANATATNATNRGLRSEGNDFFCLDCGARARIDEAGFFETIGGAKNLPDTILEWNRMQIESVKAFDFSPFAEKPLFVDSDITLLSAEYAKKEHFVCNGRLEFYNDRFRISDSVFGYDFPFAETRMAIQGSRKMTFYYKDAVYALVCPPRGNLMKYMVCGYHLKNAADGTKDEYYGY